MAEKKNYVEGLDELVAEYCEYPSPNTQYAVLNGLFEGIEKNYALPCPAEMDAEGNFRIMFATDENGKESIVALTRLNGEMYPVMADVKMRRLVRILMDTECIGIVLNPGGAREFTVPKTFLAYALSAGYQMALEDMSTDN